MAEEPTSALQFVLSFIAGKDQGREFPLPPDLDIVIGRVSDVDLLLLDVKVSRKHAKISTHEGRIIIEDLNSKNGVFVNGRRVSSQALKTGDEIVIGSSTMRLLPISEAGAKSTSRISTSELAVAPATGTSAPLISGSLVEVGLQDLLQLFSTSGKTGVLVLRSPRGTGFIHLRNGQVFCAAIEGKRVVGARKALFRMFGWDDGSFAFTTPKTKPPRDEIIDSTTSTVLEAMRQMDEMRIIAPKVPPLNAKLEAADPLPGSLRDLATEEIQLFQLVLHHKTVEAVIDSFPEPDLEAYTCLLALIRRGFVVVE